VLLHSSKSLSIVLPPSCTAFYTILVQSSKLASINLLEVSSNNYLCSSIQLSIQPTVLPSPPNLRLAQRNANQNSYGVVDSTKNMKSRASRIKRSTHAGCVTSQQDFWRRTKVTTNPKKDIVNRIIRTLNSSNCDEQDDDGCRNSSTGYCCVMKLQCKWIQISVCDKSLHENCTMLSKTRI